MTEPTTEAGQAMAAQLQALNLSPDPESTWAEDAIAAIEAEAVAAWLGSPEAERRLAEIAQNEFTEFEWIALDPEDIAARILAALRRDWYT